MAGTLSVRQSYLPLISPFLCTFLKINLDIISKKQYKYIFKECVVIFHLRAKLMPRDSYLNIFY